VASTFFAKTLINV